MQNEEKQQYYGFFPTIKDSEFWLPTSYPNPNFGGGGGWCKRKYLDLGPALTGLLLRNLIKLLYWESLLFTIYIPIMVT